MNKILLLASCLGICFTNQAKSSVMDRIDFFNTIYSQTINKTNDKPILTRNYSDEQYLELKNYYVEKGLDVNVFEKYDNVLNELISHELFLINQENQ